MLAAIFRIDNDNYYLETNNNSYNIVLSNNSETRVLTESEAKELLDNIFGGKKVFKEKRDGYDIYIDESGNKRFFKDGKEDFEKFYYSNGEDALLYYDNDQYDGNFLKRFYMKNREAITGFIIGSLLAVPIWNAYDAVSHNFYYDGNKIAIVKEMTTDLAKDYINDSFGIDEEQKEYLINDDFFNDVLNISDNSRNYILNKKLTNVTIKYDEEVCKKEQVLGLYHPTNPNILTLKDESYIDKALAHEFVHLMQDNNKYLYVLEASAEIMAHEYYDSRAWSYPTQRENLCILLEMIGPKPIIELNFKGDTSSFEKAIYDNLDKEKADRLLELFTASPLKDKDIKGKNKEIRSLLNDMSYNITGMDLDNPNNDILAFASGRDVFFNKHLPEYFDSTKTELFYSFPVDLKSTDIKNFNYYEYEITHEISKEEYEKCKDVKKKNERVCMKNYSKYKYHIDFDKKERKVYYNFGGELLTFDEAKDKGYIEKKYYRKNYKSCTSYDEIEKEIPGNNRIKIYADVNEKRSISVTIDNDRNSIKAIYGCSGYVIPSLAEKFPDQFNDKRDSVNKEIEILNIDDESVNDSPNSKNRLR